MYVMLATRPDLAYTVSMLSQFNKNPNGEHWNALNHVMRYIQSTKLKGLIYETDKLDVYGYTDTDWGGDLDTRCSMTGNMYVSVSYTHLDVYKRQV